MRRRSFIGGVAGTAGTGLTGCAGRERTDDRDTTDRVDPATDNGAVPPVPDATAYAYTHLRADGNRVVDASVDLAAVDPTDVALDGPPAWVVGLVGEGGPRWLVALADGRLRRVGPDGRVDDVVVPRSLPAGTPPVATVANGTLRALAHPVDASNLSHPVVVDGRLVFVANDGDLVVRTDGEGDRRFDVDALPDARPVVVDGRVVVLAGATDRYAHGALGDDVEAGQVAVLDPITPAVETFRVADGAVVEGIAPLVADFGDGNRLVVTESDPKGGARPVVYGFDGRRVAAGTPLGTGFRWRHQLAVAPFAPDGVPELAVVRTPHIGGTVEFYRPADGDLEVPARVDGYSSHAYGSRVLDGAVAADANDDGRPELVVPTDDRRRLGVVARVDNENENENENRDGDGDGDGDGDTSGARTVATLSVGGAVSTNVAAASGDRLSVAVGYDESLRVW
jgi:hypothetical protein